MLPAARLGGVHTGGAASGVSTPQTSEVGMPCCEGTQCWVVSSHPSHVVFPARYMLGFGSSGRWTCVWSLFQGSAIHWQGICQSYTLSRFDAGVTEHFPCLYRPGLKDANKPRNRLLRRKLWSVRFFPLVVFPTISQTLAAEALAMSMEAPMGNARDAAEEKRIRRKGENAKVRAPR